MHVILKLLAAGVPTEEVIGDEYYPRLTREHIRAALEYAAQVTEAGELVPLAATR